jgi:hypothetical protein
MWTKSYSQTVKDLSAERVWDVWTDVNQWHAWQDDVEYACLDGAFESGKKFAFRPKGGPDIEIELTEVRKNSTFVDVTRFPFARMIDSHELIEHGDELEIKCTVTMVGPLAFVWRKLVGEGVANGLPEQTRRLIERAQHA